MVIYMKNYIQHIIFLCIFFILVGCDERKEAKSLGESELYFNERLASISAESDTSFWIGGENGDIWYKRQKDIKEYNIGCDRIYKIVTDTTLEGHKVCWIGIRNSGLQKWELASNGSHLIQKFTIPNKGHNYSVYDIVLFKNKLYVATSQGLYSMSRNKPGGLKLIYPTKDSETACSGKPFIINGMQIFNGSHLVCATQNGLLKLSLITGKVKFEHTGKYISNVSVYNNRIYSLAKRTLYIEDIYGKLEKEVNMDFSSRVYYQFNNVHYFFDDNLLTLSNDLEQFTSVPLRRSIPSHCNNIIATDKGLSATLLITKSALWNLPLHLDVFYTNGEIIASCRSSKAYYFLNSRNELYRQSLHESVAEKDLDFPYDEVIGGMMIDEPYLYYISNKQVLKRIKLKKGYISNSLFTSPEVVYQSPTKITAYCLKKTANGNSIYLGIQDDLVHINSNGKAHLVSDLDNNYITAFYSPDDSENIYIATLNNGVYYGHDEKFNLISGTENNAFIRDISVVNGHTPLLMLLTNHHFICKEHNDSIPLKGYDRILQIDDSVFYALSENGLTKITESPEGFRKSDKYFNDINFTPNSAQVVEDTLVLGSNIGIMNLTANNETSPRWINMKDSVPNLKTTILVLSLLIILLLIMIEEYFRRKQGRKRMTLIHIKDISNRLDSLSSMTRFGTSDDEKEVQQFKESLRSIDVNDKEVLQKINHLSELIMKKNQDIALVLSKHLNKQIIAIETYHSFDRPLLIKESREALSSNNLQEIVRQVEKNEKWLKAMSGLQKNLSFYINSIKDTVKIENLTIRFNQEMNVLIEDISRKELSSLRNEINKVEQLFSFLSSNEALEEIDQYLLSLLEQMSSLETDRVTEALCSEINHIRKEMSETERIQLLKHLNPIDQHVRQLVIKDKLASLIKEYTLVRSRLEQKNKARMIPKSGTDLASEIAENMKLTTDEIGRYISLFYESLKNTDEELINDILEFSNFNNQPSKVLALLLAEPKVKRLYVPGMLCIYGNLNPVISRLMNNKLKVHEDDLEIYVKSNPTSIAYYVLNLVKHT